MFMQFAQHPKLPISCAISLMEISINLARSQIVYTRVSLKLILILLSKFVFDKEFLDSLFAIVRQVLKTLAQQDQEKVNLYS